MTDPRFPIGPFHPPAALDPEGREGLLGDIAETPRHLRAAVQGLSTGQILTPYRDGGWTVAQVVHHLVDSHVNSYIRFKLAITEEVPTIKPYAEALWAELPDASDPDLNCSLLLLDSLHDRWVRFLRSLDGDQWERSFRHPERGLVTLAGTLALYAWHGRHHVAHITGLRKRMGW